MSQIETTRSQTTFVPANANTPAAPDSSVQQGTAVVPVVTTVSQIVDTVEVGQGNQVAGVSGSSAPRVDGAVSYDPALGAVTQQDLNTITTAVAESQSSGDSDTGNMERLLAKLLIAFQSTDDENAKELIEQARARAKADQAREAEKTAKTAELIDTAQGNPCQARPRLEAKLEELGYTPDQAKQLAKNMTAKNISPGAQALMAMEAVKNAPAYKDSAVSKDAATTTNPVTSSDAAADAKASQYADQDAKEKMALLEILLGAYGNVGEEESVSSSGAKPASGTQAVAGAAAASGGSAAK